MTFKDLNIKPTYLFRANFKQLQSELDDQFYNYFLPFQVNDRVYLIDTYHIECSGSYENHIKALQNTSVFKCIPFVQDFYYQHYFEISSIEFLEDKFTFVGDLEDYHICEKLEEIYNFNDEDKIMFVWLYYGQSKPINLIKNGSRKNELKEFNNLLCKMIRENRSIINLNCYDKERLDELFKKNKNLIGFKNVNLYEQFNKYYDFLKKENVKISKEYKKLIEVNDNENDD